MIGNGLHANRYQMKNTALVTGASGGLGAEFARLHAAAGNDVVIIARSKEKLAELKNELETKYGIKAYCIVKDLSMPESAEEIYGELLNEKIVVDFLINNAGFGSHGRFSDQKLTVHENMINLNIIALVKLTYLLLPSMISRKTGKILNVSSTAGYLPGPMMGVYYASKSFVNSFSLALYKELKGTGVTITVFCPGLVQTGFSGTAGTEGTRYYALAKGSTAKKSAQAGYTAMMKGKPVIFDNPLLSFILRYLLPVTPLKLVLHASEWAMKK